MTSWHKLSEAVGSATPDPDKATATTQPIPPPVVANKPPPGRKGPVGLQPRQTFSRVNTGAPPVPDAGSSSQKSLRPRGLEFLPAKVAHQENDSMTTTMIARMPLKDLVKEAMEGTVSKVNISLEHAQQLVNQGGEAPEEETKHASVSFTPDDHIEKVANALDYLAKQAAEGVGTTVPGPGSGPNALEVSAPKSNEENIDTKGRGQATAKHVVPQSPPMESSGVASDPSNAMGTNVSMQHAEQPADPMGNEKTSSPLFDKNLARLGLSKTASKQPAKGTTKQASSLLDKNLARLGLSKLAEDAINPAQISGGGTHDAAKPPEGATPSEEGVPSEPSDVNKQKSLISSNQAAIDYTKGQAKADPKSDANKVLTEPAQTKSTDPVLQNTLDNTGKAGVKISSASLTRHAAAQALLSKLAQELDEEEKKKAGKKEKSSQMGGGLGTPAGQSGFSASGMM